MRKLLIIWGAIFTLLIAGCLGSNRQITGSNERIWWREINAPEWNEFVGVAPVDSDMIITINIAPIESHTCPIVVHQVIKFGLSDEQCIPIHGVVRFITDNHNTYRTNHKQLAPVG